MMVGSEHAESGVRQRTRQAITDAAIAVWSRDFTASLGDIADRAAVSRSTLHRYFPHRQSLIDAALIDSMGRLVRASDKARAAGGSARDELESLMRALIEHGDVLIFLFSDPDRFTDNAHWDESEDVDLLETIARAQSDGAVAADVDPSWVVGIFYSICYVAAQSVSTDVMAPHRAGDVAVRTFFHGVGGAGQASAAR